MPLYISLEHHEFRYFYDWICGFSVQGHLLVSSVNEKDIIPCFFSISVIGLRESNLFRDFHQIKLCIENCNRQLLFLSWLLEVHSSGINSVTYSSNMLK